MAFQPEPAALEALFAEYGDFHRSAVNFERVGHLWFLNLAVRAVALRGRA